MKNSKTSFHTLTVHNVTGTFRHVRLPENNEDPEALQCNIRRLPSAFPPDIWNMHNNTLNDEARTNNMSETWNSSFKQLVGHSHPSFYTVIDNIRKDETLVKTMMLQDDRGEPPKKRTKRNYVRLQKRLKNLCGGIVAGRKSTEEFL